jgi:hypothetical protein
MPMIRTLHNPQRQDEQGMARINALIDGHVNCNGPISSGPSNRFVLVRQPFVLSGNNVVIQRHLEGHINQTSND